MGIIPNNDIMYCSMPLLDGSTENMNVDGSSVNVTYKHVLSTDEVFYLESINIFLMDDAATLSRTNFGGLAGLSTGLKVLVKKNDSDLTFKNLKTNVDILKTFNREVIVGNSATGFLNSNDYFFGSLVFKTPIRLVDGDAVKIVIKDDLRGLDELSASITMWEAL